MELGGTIARCAVGMLLAGAVFAGCSGAGSAINPTGLGSAPQSIDGKAGSQKLLYLAHFVQKQVWVYKYPITPSESPYQQLTGFGNPLGECSNGTDVWIVDEGASQILEYEAGGTTPIATLQGEKNEYPFTCSYDPTTGNLAVANGATARSNVKPTVMVYTHATGTPTSYSCKSVYHHWGHGFSFIGYDNSGNLFVDGWGEANYTPVLCELPKGASKMNVVTLDRALSSPGQIQWDGRYLAVGDYVTDAIYRVNVKRFKGTTKRTTALGGGYTHCVQFWIDDHTVVCPTQADQGTPIYNFPQGGSPVQVVAGNSGVWGATIATMGSKK